MTKYINRETAVENSKKKTKTDKFIRLVFLIISLLCSSSVIFILILIIYKGISPFINDYVIDGIAYRLNVWDFLTGTSWSGNGGTGYGAGFIVMNTIYVTFFTVLLAAPISIITALVVVRMTNEYFGKIIGSVIELLASIPSVIFGMFGLGVITGWTKSIAEIFDYQTFGGQSNLTVILVLTMMSIPTITMISITALRSVNQNVITGSLALGASLSQTNYKVVLKSAKSGIFSGAILGVNRALGEATAVTMVAGNITNGPSFNLFATTRTLTSTMLAEMGEATGLNYDVRFSCGILLIFLIIFINFLLLRLKNKMGTQEYGK
ncbi:MAG: ABC transporter permease subunit [Bacilli bacterium]